LKNRDGFLTVLHSFLLKWTNPKFKDVTEVLGLVLIQSGVGHFIVMLDFLASPVMAHDLKLGIFPLSLDSLCEDIPSTTLSYSLFSH
jgi:hypothetical protein